MSTTSGKRNLDLICIVDCDPIPITNITLCVSLYKLRCRQACNHGGILGPCPPAKTQCPPAKNSEIIPILVKLNLIF